MNLQPVIERELISEARNPTNHWLRLLAAGGLLSLTGLHMLNEPAGGPSQGALLFHRMNGILQVATFLLVPIITADAVAREKREGTLGLLFLTPLRARDIIIGKTLVLGVRALTIQVAALPMLCLPMVMGGVGITDFLTLAALNVTALCLTLAAGIHASVRQVERIRAIGHALLISAGVAIFFFPLAAPFPSGIRRAAYFVMMLLGPALGAVVLWGTLNQSATWLARHWQRELVRPPQPEWVDVFAGSVFWQTLFHWNRARALDRNPMVWLQEYSWTARLTKWGWFLLVLSTPLLGGCAGSFFMDYTTWLAALTLFLAGGMAFTATGTFRSDRESGALELLLVTPLSARQILNGRYLGLLAHFLPASLLLGFFWFVPFWFDQRLDPSVWCNFLFGISTLITIPFVGVRLALERLHFVAAWLAALLVGYLVPMGAAVGIQILGGRQPGSVVLAAAFFSLFQLGLAAVCHRGVLRALHGRRFAAAGP